MTERIAYICTHNDCDPPRRVFLRSEPDTPPHCGEHGRMRRQVNMPYNPSQDAKPTPKVIEPPRRRPRRPAGS